MKPIKCACCTRLNPSMVCFKCRQYMKAFLKYKQLAVSLIVAYVTKRRREQEGIINEKETVLENLK